MAKETNKRVYIWINNHEVENNIKAIRAEFNKVANELKKATIGSEEYNQKLKELKKLKEILDEHSKAVQTVAEAHAENKKNMQNSAMAWGGAAAAIQGATAAVRRFVSTVQQYVDAYAKVDDAMQAVVKSSGLARTQVEYLRESLMKLDTKTSTEELLKIAEIGGHLGLNEKQLRDFVESTDQAMQTIGLSAEEVANGFSKIQRQFSDVANQDISVTIKQAGSAMNALDVVTTSTESNIMAFTEAVGRLSDGIKPTLADTLALGAAFESAGVDAEQAATGYARILTTARANVDKFAESMGRPAEEIRNLINTNPAQFLLEFGESLRNLPTTEQGEKLKEIGLGSARLDATLGALINHTDEFRTALTKSNEEYVKATAMTENFNALNSTSAAQLEKAKKKMEDARAELGKELIPTLTQLYETLNKGAGWIKEHIVLVKAVVKLIVGWIAVIGAYKTIQISANVLLDITNRLHKVYRLALIASAGAQALFNKNLTRAKASLVLVRREFPLLTKYVTNLKGSLSSLGSVFMKLVRFGPAAWLAGIVHMVIKANKEANRGKRVIEEVRKSSSEAMAQSRSEIEMEKIKINQLRSVIQDENAERDKKLRAIQALQAIVPGYFAELSEEGRLIRENTGAIDAYMKNVEKMAMTRVLESQLESILAEMEEERNAAHKWEEWADSNNIFKKIWASVHGAGSWNTGNGYSRQALHDLNGEKEKILQEISDLRSPEETASQNSHTEDADACKGFENGCTCPSCQEKRNEIEAEKLKQIEILRRQKAFLKKLSEMREAEQDEMLEGWEKIKKEVINKYKSLEEEAIELFGRNSQTVRQVIEQRNMAISEAGQKYLNDMSQTIDKLSNVLSEKLEDLLPDKDGDNPILAAIRTTDNEWNNEIKEAQKKYEELSNAIVNMSHDDPLYAVFNEQLEQLSQFFDQSTDKQYEAHRLIVNKYADEELKKIQQKNKEQQRQIELNKVGITEEKKAALQRQWRIDDLREEYDAEIELFEAVKRAREESNEGDTENIAKLQQIIDELKKLRDNVEYTVDGVNIGIKKTGNALIDLLTGAITDPKERYNAVIDVMQDFANKAIDIYHQIADAQQESAELEMERFVEAQDAKSRKLQQQLDEGLISQKYYDAQMEKMEAEKEKREKNMKHEQFEREREASIAEALIQGGLAVARGFADWGWPGGLIVGALTTAETGVQLGIIASQVNPYARGGYIRKKQLALVGEKGPEWVASNTLLEDNETAPVIAALEDYQRGNRSPLRMVAPTQPAWKNLSQSASQISSTFASNRTPVVHHHYQTAGGDELLKEVKQMNQFLADPKNRQAYISYKIQTEAQKNRDFIKQAAKL